MRAGKGAATLPRRAALPRVSLPGAGRPETAPVRAGLIPRAVPCPGRSAPDEARLGAGAAEPGLTGGRAAEAAGQCPAARPCWASRAPAGPRPLPGAVRCTGAHAPAWRVPLAHPGRSARSSHRRRRPMREGRPWPRWRPGSGRRTAAGRPWAAPSWPRRIHGRGTRGSSAERMAAERGGASCFDNPPEPGHCGVGTLSAPQRRQRARAADDPAAPVSQAAHEPRPPEGAGSRKGGPGCPGPPFTADAGGRR